MPLDATHRPSLAGQPARERFHAAETLQRSPAVAEPALCTAITQPAEELQRALLEEHIQPEVFWSHGIPLAADNRGMKELGEVTLTKVLGRNEVPIRLIGYSEENKMFWLVVNYVAIDFILESVGFGCLVCLLLTRRGRLPSVRSIGFIVFLIFLFRDIFAVLGFPELQLTIKTSNQFLIRLYGTDDLSDKLFQRAFPFFDYMDVIFAAIKALIAAPVARWLARRAFGEDEVVHRPWSGSDRGDQAHFRPATQPEERD